MLQATDRVEEWLIEGTNPVGLGETDTNARDGTAMIRQCADRGGTMVLSAPAANPGAPDPPLVHTSIVLPAPRTGP